MTWHDRAARLAGEATHPASRWHPLVAVMPRHDFAPAWWERDFAGWIRRDATTHPEVPYRNRSLVTQAGTRHADHAAPGERADGPATCSSTKPGLVITMYELAMIRDGMDVLDVGTGTGYGAGLLCLRAGDQHVTSIDVDPYLTESATRRLGEMGLHPKVATSDATGPLPGSYDRIVSMTSVSPVPASWLAALRPGGRIVTTVAGTGLIITADRTEDGGATGRAEWQRGGFMPARSGPGYPPPLLDKVPEAADGDGTSEGRGRYPVVDVENAWELRSMLGVTMPGTEAHYEEGGGQRTAWLAHPDGSWARADDAGDGTPPVVRQAGPRRLWDHLDSIRETWLRDGNLPVYGSKVTIALDGAITFSRGKWSATIPAVSS